MPVRRPQCCSRLAVFERLLTVQLGAHDIPPDPLPNGAPFLAWTFHLLGPWAPFPVPFHFANSRYNWLREIRDLQKAEHSPKRVFSACTRHRHRCSKAPCRLGLRVVDLAEGVVERLDELVAALVERVVEMFAELVAALAERAVERLAELVADQLVEHVFDLPAALTNWMSLNC